MQMKSQKIQINVYKVTMLVGGSIFSTIFNKIALLFPFILLMGYGLSVQAAEEAKAPDAGQILQQIERDIKVKPLQTIPEVPAESTPAPIDEGPHIIIKQFNFVGNHVLSEAALQAAVAPLTHRSITVSELKTSLNLITALYRQHGYLVTVTWPEQDITDGVVLIKIVEAVLGDIKFDGSYGKDFKRVKPSVIARYIESVAHRVFLQSLCCRWSLRSLEGML